MDRFWFDAAATLAKIRETQALRPIVPIVPTDTSSRGQIVGTIGTVEGSPTASERQPAKVIDAAERFERRGRRQCTAVSK